ncbi:MAG: hypothetical protein JWN39_1227 [Ilumatobacteraceae bacterium]|nr:hypothetical protein [Ilumatobacteraceae bacterium]
MGNDVPTNPNDGDSTSMTVTDVDVIEAALAFDGVDSASFVAVDRGDWAGTPDGDRTASAFR